jgi:NDP-4-keto-2,6-dideoxyhexose 3-C-methyltransferase
MDILRRIGCRSCGTILAPVLSLGPIYLSDFPRSAGTRAHPPVPLDLTRCTNPACTLVQLAHTTPPDWMFRQYWYRSNVNESMRAELADIVRDATSRVDLPHHAVVVDIGANDGTLLQQYPQGLTTVAWEPAANLYEALRPHANVLYPEYFHVEADSWGLESKARIISVVACFYDLDDPHVFLEGITRILHPEGVLVIQQAYLPAMLAATAFDNLCHEHLTYQDLRSLEAMLEPHGLRVFDVVERAINGGSFRALIGFADHWGAREAVEALRRKELAFYADRPRVFEAFAHKVERVKAQLQAILAMYTAKGATVDLLGASTKGSTLIQYCGLDARTIRQAWERSPEKWGRYYSVSAIPIVSDEEGRKDPPAVLLSTIWQFRDSLLAREAEYLSKGGRIVFPLPHVETVLYGAQSHTPTYPFPATSPED